MEHVLQKPLEDPPSKQEMKAAGMIVCNMLSQSSTTVTLPTGEKKKFAKIYHII